MVACQIWPISRDVVENFIIFLMRYLSDDLSRNRGWYLNDYICNLYRPVQKVEEQLNPPN